MIHEEWLGEYRTIDGVERTLKRISKRSKSLQAIENASVYLERYSEEMESHFLQFYPALTSYLVGIRPVRQT